MVKNERKNKLQIIMRNVTVIINEKVYDLDPVSVKMCTLNMTINGMTGIVTHANSLTGKVFGCYVVNEVKYPLPCPACSIRCVFRNK